jgi:hypothetical protein
MESAESGWTASFPNGRLNGPFGKAEATLTDSPLGANGYWRNFIELHITYSVL